MSSQSKPFHVDKTKCSVAHKFSFKYIVEEVFKTLIDKLLLLHTLSFYQVRVWFLSTLFGLYY